MTFQSYLWGLRTTTFFVFCMWVVIIFFVDVDIYGIFAYSLFYGTFFLFTAGLSILILTQMWRSVAKEIVTVAEISMALRQGVLIGILMSVVVFMQQMRILVWWDAIMVMVAILLIEFYFLTKPAR